MSNLANLRARLLVAGTLLATIGAAPAAAAPWDAQGGTVYVTPPAGASPVVFSESFKTALAKSKVTVTARSGAVAAGDGKFSLPVSRIEWFASDRTLSLQGASHRGLLEFRGRNGLRIGLGNLRPRAGGGFADLYVNGARIAGGLPVLTCAPLQGDDFDPYVAAVGDQNGGVECPLRIVPFAGSLLNGLTGSRAFGRGTLAYVAVVPNGYGDPALAPVPPNSGVN